MTQGKSISCFEATATILLKKELSMAMPWKRPSSLRCMLGYPHSQEGKTEVVGYFWSGLHGKVVKGITLVTLFYGEVGGMRMPVNLRGWTKLRAFSSAIARCEGVEPNCILEMPPDR